MKRHLKKLDRAVMELRGQLTVLVIIFAGGLVLAIVIATQRGFAENYVREKYEFADKDVPNRILRAASSVEEGGFDRKSFARLNEQLRRELYEDWINRSDPPRPDTPSELVRLKPQFYLDCAEKTVVCGSTRQQERAVEFLAASESTEAIDVLQRLGSWARRRNLVELAETIDAILLQVESEDA